MTLSWPRRPIACASRPAKRRQRKKVGKRLEPYLGGFLGSRDGRLRRLASTAHLPPSTKATLVVVSIVVVSSSLEGPCPPRPKRSGLATPSLQRAVVHASIQQLRWPPAEHGKVSKGDARTPPTRLNYPATALPQSRAVAGGGAGVTAHRQSTQRRSDSEGGAG